MIVVAIIGFLAAVAMPAFQKYLKRTKTTEARLLLRKIYDGQIAYYDIDHITRSGIRASSQFVSAGPTPPNVPPGQAVIGDWTVAGWTELKVSSDSGVWYRYTSITTGDGTDAEFTARAEGDIDNDGTTSLFERIASVDKNNGNVQGSSGLFTSNDLE
jgi:type IV pilus assembly protein PilA